MWIVADRTRSHKEMVERRFLSGAAGLSLRVEQLLLWSLLLCIEINQLRWVEHLIRVLPERLPLEIFQVHPSHRKETPGRTQNSLDGLCILSGLGTP